ncbi:MAG: 16S rRNA (cytosine(1402)-N(4))-methyltransferase [Candidatus Yanofskybacteria bacterium CG10_big_fil_rev_8_21_14_0_10_46_23]|uniref:Ribosomal RNA small subunit methyltransferase H n=1 Tax=Candidatus Yanofskybacteria bacterium CG10_big_fil_rev_8_21_14_0_10_46_23 TaxID=1975098 RepID=A0A2H0R5Q6_9BACT|nr:MAG: 16S rRNA (cytosine(1402)-N(4))-methyltransferase [Candidatus Yanofskybacteria bacterium CG10_big_fil_rev_8_21_14_0_10_46_23]
MAHNPVLLKEVLEYLAPRKGERYVDATFHEGGHSQAILEAIDYQGQILGIEWDSEVFKRAQTKAEQAPFKNKITLVNENYVELSRIVQGINFEPVSGILFDFGMASWHIEESGRGFSFNKEEPLDMRYSPTTKITAEDVINSYSPANLEHILQTYGEEKFTHRIVRAIVVQRAVAPITTSKQLADLIAVAVPVRAKIHPATKTFQALRIEVNQELENVQRGIEQVPDVLAKGGRAVAISFHALEDGIVKRQFRQWKEEGLGQILTKKPVMASVQEINQNPRARSARLRAFKKNG